MLPVTLVALALDCAAASEFLRAISSALDTLRWAFRLGMQKSGAGSSMLIWRLARFIGGDGGLFLYSSIAIRWLRSMNFSMWCDICLVDKSTKQYLIIKISKQMNTKKPHQKARNIALAFWYLYR